MKVTQRNKQENKETEMERKRVCVYVSVYLCVRVLALSVHMWASLLENDMNKNRSRLNVVNFQSFKWLLKRKLYLKLIESPVKPSSNLGASSQKFNLLETLKELNASYQNPQIKTSVTCILNETKIIVQISELKKVLTNFYSINNFSKFLFPSSTL